MGLYTIHLSDDQIHELLDGDRKWFDLGAANVSIEADDGVDHFTVREDAAEEGHKCGVKFSPATFERMLEDPSHGAGGWTAVEGGKLSSNQQIEVIVAHEDHPAH